MIDCYFVRLGLPSVGCQCSVVESIRALIGNTYVWFLLLISLSVAVCHMALNFHHVVVA